MREQSPPSGLDPDPLVGRTIAGKFAIEARLGAGAMGTVYRARQIALDKTVAVKVLNGDVASDPTFAERFGREARAASRLDHPNSIRVFDFGQDADGLLFLVMEYVEGRDLRALLSESGSLAPASAVELVAQILGALSVAHDMGVLHRDLKPENVLVVRGKGDDGQPVDVVKVCDFGIAKIIGQARASEPPGGKRTTSGIVVGTPEYMSPEQARGEAMDGRSDVYAVGVVLYELLVGVPPFDGTTPLNIVLKHIGERPEPPSVRRPGVGAKLEAVCLKAMEKRPDDRYPGAREMRRALLESLGGAAAGAGTLSYPRVAGAASSGRTSASPPTPASEKPTLEGLAPVGSEPVPRRGRGWLVGGVCAVAASAAVAMAARATSRPEPPPAMIATPVSEPSPPVTAPLNAAPAPAAMVAAVVAAMPQPVAPEAKRSVEVKGRPSRRNVVSEAVAPEGREMEEAAASAPAPKIDPVPATAPAAAPAIAPPIAVAPATATVAAISPAAPIPPYDLASSRVDVSPALNPVGVTSFSVSRTLSEATGAVTACYRAALPRLAAPLDGRGTLHIETDGDGVITDARLAFGSDESLAACVSRAVVGRRLANVDTGNASADVPLTFRAR